MRNRKSRWLTPVVLLISTSFWILLIFDPGNLLGEFHCHVSETIPMCASGSVIDWTSAPFQMMLGWTVMVFAMMLPKLIPPVQQIMDRSFAGLRLGLAFLFISGYSITWILAGIILNGFILAVFAYVENSDIIAVLVGIIAMVYQFSPAKQYFLNLGHKHVSLAAFGWPAMRDAIKFGIQHGTWCVGSGWALMLFPMLLEEGHNIAMILVSFVMLSEHLERPKVPSWRLDFRMKLFRIIYNQTKIRMNAILIQR